MYHNHCKSIRIFFLHDHISFSYDNKNKKKKKKKERFTSSLQLIREFLPIYVTKR